MRTSFHCVAAAFGLAFGLALDAPYAAAQLIRVPPPTRSGPAISVTGGAGLLLTGSRYDAADGDLWVFSEAISRTALATMTA